MRIQKMTFKRLWRIVHNPTRTHVILDFISGIVGHCFGMFWKHLIRVDVNRSYELLKELEPIEGSVSTRASNRKRRLRFLSWCPGGIHRR